VHGEAYEEYRRQVGMLLPLPGKGGRKRLTEEAVRPTGAAQDTPGVLAPPPLIFLVPIGTALLVDYLVPAVRLPGPAPPMLGWCCIILGVLLMLSAVVAMRRARTAISPYKASTALVARGPYRVSRNPIYVADALVYVGIALLMRSLLGLILLPVVVVVMNRGVIAREERYLEAKFGEEYERYKMRVRRWL
jgi:protein-S-isoprenylcysteine O-methyltransferase Ste14